MQTLLLLLKQNLLLVGLESETVVVRRIGLLEGCLLDMVLVVV